MKKFIVEKTVRLPDTKIILEKGDIFIVIKEAEATVGIPSDTIVVPYSMPVPGYDNEGSSAIIDAGREVKYKTEITDAGFLLTLYYSHLKNMPFKFVKVPILFTSKQEAETKGWNFIGNTNSGIVNTIPSGTELNGDEGIVDSKTMNEKDYDKERRDKRAKEISKKKAAQEKYDSFIASAASSVGIDAEALKRMVSGSILGKSQTPTKVAAKYIFGNEYDFTDLDFMSKEEIDSKGDEFKKKYKAFDKLGTVLSKAEDMKEKLDRMK